METFRQIVDETMRAAGLSEEELKDRMQIAERAVGFDKRLDRELSPVQEAQVRKYLLEMYATNQTPEGKKKIEEAAQKFREARVEKSKNN